MSEFIVTRVLQGCNTPYKIWILEHKSNPLYSGWVLEWYKDRTQKEFISLWDNTEYLNEVCVKGTTAKKEFKKFVKENYPNEDVKLFYKEFKRMWKFKDGL